MNTLRFSCFRLQTRGLRVSCSYFFAFFCFWFCHRKERKKVDPCTLQPPRPPSPLPLSPCPVALLLVLRFGGSVRLCQAAEAFQCHGRSYAPLEIKLGRDHRNHDAETWALEDIYPMNFWKFESKVALIGYGARRLSQIHWVFILSYFLTFCNTGRHWGLLAVQGRKSWSQLIWLLIWLVFPKYCIGIGGWRCTTPCSRTTAAWTRFALALDSCQSSCVNKPECWWLQVITS